jgi:hypothetical protein
MSVQLFTVLPDGIFSNQKIPIRVNFGVSYKDGGKFGLFSSISYILHMAIWNNLWSFGYFFPVLVCCTKKNLATSVIQSNFYSFLRPFQRAG